MRFHHLDLYTLYRNAPSPVRNIVDVFYRFVPERMLRSQSTWDFMRKFLLTQWLTPAELESLQLERLKTLLAHAEEHVPYYRELFKKIGFHTSQMDSIRNLAALPVLTIDMVRSLGQELLSDVFSPRSLYKIATSGSTGRYMEFYQDKEHYNIEHAFTLRYLQWYGITIRWRHAIFYRAIMSHPDSRWASSPAERYRNRLILSQFHTDDQSFGRYVALLRDFKPDYITSFPSTLLMLTRYCRRTGDIFHRPKLFINYSENLYEEHRAEMEDFWQCRIYNRYGHSEACVSAAECEEGRMHISSEYGYVEFLRRDGSEARPGEIARIVGTGFHNHAMPFIRYDTGDLGVLSGEPCRCGRGLPVLERIDGRADDMIRTKDGKHVSALRAIFEHSRGIRFTQIVQEEIGSIIIRLVPDEDYDPSVQDLILKNLKENIGDALNVRFVLVDDVERAPSGKIRLVLSKVGKTLSP